MEFGRLALAAGSGGAVEVAAGTDQARLDPQLVDLGGVRYSVVVRVTGEPGAQVRLSWPEAVVLRSSTGGEPVRLDSIRSDSRAVLTLDGGGRAQLALGARLTVPAGADGEYRGQIAVVAEYD